jgi:hypothetical protein
MSTPNPGAVPGNAQPAQTGCLAPIVRLLWLAAGNFTLLILLVLIAMKGRFSALDMAYWLTIAAVLFLRFAEIRFLGGVNPEGGRSTMKDWRKYMLIVLGVAGGGWAMVRIVHLLARH